MSFDKENTLLREKKVREAEFRNEARNILSKDRELSKMHINKDTGADIKRALEHAYQLGLSHGKKDYSEPSGAAEESQLQWLMIPKRARDAFETIMQFNLVVIAEDDFKGDREWGCYYKQKGDSYRLLKTYASGTLNPLINLGLMGEFTIKTRIKPGLATTVLGKQIWMQAIKDGYAKQR